MLLNVLSAIPIACSYNDCQLVRGCLALGCFERDTLTVDSWVYIIFIGECV